ncbi:hypothetical protein [Neomoorella thermoacetica]|uniref:hypothetical protein n=1 Tax=Neomoorella thermoacetica TaxID=1525 RepID=UPI0008FAD8C4|nr:hypothetical protein [Moorella thermoacetica]OIQ11573.1 hypothetical protein MOOTH_15590 [Moorella thermoacetica]
MGEKNPFVPVHVIISDLVLVPESEIIVMKLPGQPPLTVYRIGPAQIEMVDEYFARRKPYSPWRKESEPIAQKRRHRSGNQASRKDTDLLPADNEPYVRAALGV